MKRMAELRNSGTMFNWNAEVKRRKRNLSLQRQNNVRRTIAGQGSYKILCRGHVEKQDFFRFEENLFILNTYFNNKTD